MRKLYDRAVIYDIYDPYVITLSRGPQRDAYILQAIFVKEGDSVVANQPVAQVGSEIVKTNTAGEIVSVNKNIGQFENAMTGQAVVATMIDQNELRVVGHLDEDKGLADISTGDLASFTVDAFDSKQYKGIVDEISPTSRATDVVFNW